ncbi:MAG: cell division protein [Rhodospirillales bacterium]|nr:cell division protein [Rhodospirillales bacterium]
MRQRLAGLARRDLALARSDRRSYVPGIVAVLVFLATLALVLALTLAGAAGRFQAGLSGTLTVEIPVPAGGQAGEARLARALEVLRQTPGIAAADPLSREHIAGLLEPWLGKFAGLEDLPLPQLIDVRLAPGATVDLAALGARLETAAPGTNVDDHRRWLVSLQRLARLAVGLAVLIVVLVAAAAAAAVAFATRAGLSVHHDAVDLLHLIGAEDRYIARQFAHEALILAFKGGLAGLVAAVAILAAIAFAATRLDAVPLPAFGLTGGDIALVAALPLAAAAIATVTAWRTTMRALARMV